MKIFFFYIIGRKITRRTPGQAALCDRQHQMHITVAENMYIQDPGCLQPRGENFFQY
jgi:hypothetical protein